MKCEICNKHIEGENYKIWAGIKWYRPNCIRYECCNICQTFDNPKFRLLLKADNKWLNKLGRWFSDDYEKIINSVVEVEFKK